MDWFDGALSSATLVCDSHCNWKLAVRAFDTPESSPHCAIGWPYPIKQAASQYYARTPNLGALERASRYAMLLKCSALASILGYPAFPVMASV